MTEQEVRGVIESLVPEYTQFLRDLIRLNSVYGSESAAQELVCRKLEALGLKVETICSRSDAESANLVARVPGKNPETHRSLILNAHCDVTPVDAPELWSHDPFSGHIENNVIYGRGALDDKAGIAVIGLVVHALRQMNVPLAGDLLIESVVEDESTGNGSKALGSRLIQIQ